MDFRLVPKVVTSNDPKPCIAVFCIISPEVVAFCVKCMKPTEARPIVSATKMLPNIWSGGGSG